MELEIMDKPYLSLVENVFSAVNINRCEKRVFSLQTKLDKAVANNDTKSIRETFNLLAKNSKAVKVLAVYRITQRNQGKYTAGVDGISMPKGDREKQNQIRLKLLDEIDITRKPDAIRRVYIPKSNGKKRPLGIPTLRDRINQEILRMAIEPIAEYHFSFNSWGFRPKRSCHDAIQHLYIKLARSKSFRYIVEGDIKGCFDNIDHNHIINTLLDWKVPKWATALTLKMLKSGIIVTENLHVSETGTPQGGVISPLLANVALTSLDNFCYNNFGSIQTNSKSGKNNPIVRYADDFVIVCKSKRMAEQVKAEITDHLRDVIGLELSAEKTSITHITKGFNFLGFNIRKYPKPHAKQKKKSDRDWKEYKLLIRPQKEKVVEFLRNCKEVLNENKVAKQASIIALLNPKLKGWGMFYRHVVSKDTFSKINHEIWIKLYFWSKRRHPQKSRSWIVQKYFSRVDNVKSVFRDSETGNYLVSINQLTIKRFVMVNGTHRVYNNNPETLLYWKKREYTNAYDQIYSVKVRRLYKRQNGKCSYCNEPIKEEQIQKTELHVHHLLPQSFGGTESYSNLKLLHQECHTELHATLSRSEMKELVNNKVDYLES
jgi:RNA-directed DNA polymerase